MQIFISGCISGRKSQVNVASRYLNLLHSKDERLTSFQGPWDCLEKSLTHKNIFPLLDESVFLWLPSRASLYGTIYSCVNLSGILPLQRDSFNPILRLLSAIKFYFTHEIKIVSWYTKPVVVRMWNEKCSGEGKPPKIWWLEENTGLSSLHEMKTRFTLVKW